MNIRPILHKAWRRTLHNLPQKLLALVAALGLWFVATGERREIVDRAFTVPLRITGNNGTQDGRRSVVGVPQTVRVTLSGPRRELVNLTDEEIEASINVADVGEGSFQVPIEVRPPRDTRVVASTPTVASGFLDTQISRTLGVQLAATNLPDRAIPRYELTPRTVQVTGAQRVVESVESIATVPVSLPRGATAEVRLIALNAQGQPVTDVNLNPATVNVQRVDRADLPLKTVDVELPEPPANLEIVSSEVSPSQVQVLADPETLAKLSSVQARVPYRVGRYSTRANLVLPEGARSLDSVTVTLEVRRKEPPATRP